MASKLWEDYENLLDADEERQRKNLFLTRQYDNADYAWNLDLKRPVGKHLNLTRAVIDTVATKIVKLDPRATFVTSGGDFRARRQAENMERWVDGLYDRLGVRDELSEQLVKDAARMGTGVWQINRNRRLTLERVHPNEVLVDPHESQRRAPRSIIRHMAVPRDVLVTMYPKLKAQIMQLPDDDLRTGSVVDELVDPIIQEDEEGRLSTGMVRVVAGWQLSSAKGVKDGRYTVVAQNQVFEDHRKLDLQSFPFLFYHWSLPATGFWGSGLADVVYPIDKKVNAMLQRALESIRRGSVPLAVVEKGSLGHNQQLSNQMLNVYEKEPGSADPHFLVPNVIGGELMQMVDYEVNKAFEMAGVSQLTATAKKPSGLDASVALREFVDIESERFYNESKRFERLVGVTLAERLIDETIALKADPDHDPEFFRTQVVDGNSLLNIDWDSIDLDRDSYVIQVFPTSSLPKNPAARRAEIAEMLQSGQISEDEARELQDMPDLKAFNDRRTAPRRLVGKIIEKILEDGEYIAPEPFFPLMDAIKEMQDAYIQAVIENVKEDRLELMRNWMDQAASLLESLQPPAPAGPLGGVPLEGGLPPGALPPGAPLPIAEGIAPAPQGPLEAPLL